MPQVMEAGPGLKPGFSFGVECNKVDVWQANEVSRLHDWTTAVSLICQLPLCND